MDEAFHVVISTSTVKSVDPNDTTSPALSGTARCRRCMLRNVPLALFRSSIVTLVSVTVMRARYQQIANRHCRVVGAADQMRTDAEIDIASRAVRGGQPDGADDRLGRLLYPPRRGLAEFERSRRRHEHDRRLRSRRLFGDAERGIEIRRLLRGRRLRLCRRRK